MRLSFWTNATTGDRRNYQEIAQVEVASIPEVGELISLPWMMPRVGANLFIVAERKGNEVRIHRAGPLKWRLLRNRGKFVLTRFPTE